MGVSFAEHKRKRKLPWPRYRVNWYDKLNYSWHEVPALYYTPAAVIKAAKAVGGMQVRIGVLAGEGQAWVYHALVDFVALTG